MNTTLPYPSDAALISHLESVQRLIAMARLGRYPARNAPRQALETLDRVSGQLRQRGGRLEHLDLCHARAALVPLTLGYLPREEACILAIREVLFVIFALTEEDAA